MCSKQQAPIANQLLRVGQLRILLHLWCIVCARMPACVPYGTHDYYYSIRNRLTLPIWLHLLCCLMQGGFGCVRNCVGHEDAARVACILILLSYRLNCRGAFAACANVRAMKTQCEWSPCLAVPCFQALMTAPLGCGRLFPIHHLHVRT